MTRQEIIDILKEHASDERKQGMSRFGIDTTQAYGISIPVLRKLAKRIGTDHVLARELWDTGIHEAKILAGMIASAEQADDMLMETWVTDVQSWDLCDQTCMNFFSKTTMAYTKAQEWAKREEEFVKRAGFALMAVIAVHDKDRDEKDFISFLYLIKTHAEDSRKYVKKAVNWALRQIGKRSITLNHMAVSAARELKQSDSRTARWIGSDALRELTNEKVQKRLEVNSLLSEWFDEK